MRVTSSVPHQPAPISLLCYLSRRFTYFSEEQWHERIREGRILINDCCVTDASMNLFRGDIVAYDMPHFDEPPADLSYQVIYEDEWILGVAKSGNCLVHKSGKSFRSNLIYQLRYCHAPTPYPGINAVHRLDRETSGVVIFAKEKDVSIRLNTAFLRREIRKEYLAIVKGIPSRHSWTALFSIGKDETPGDRCKFRIDTENGKPAQTHFEIAKALNFECTLLRARPVTGRTHQIRVHLAASGLNLIGDKVYGAITGNRVAGEIPCKEFRGIDCFPRQALHCASIGFDHPVTKEALTIEAPFPADMNTLLQTLQ
jgi:23S rRNA pseudouridine1911/1915/1917 synthase